MNGERSLDFPVDLPGRGDYEPEDYDDPYDGPYFCSVCGSQIYQPPCYCNYYRNDPQ